MGQTFGQESWFEELRGRDEDESTLGVSGNVP
jgi:hypothetical protein